MNEKEVKLGKAPKKAVRNNEDLRNDLLACYDELRKGTIGLREAKEFSNMAGKVINSAKAQMDYNAYVGNTKPIDFFEC